MENIFTSVQPFYVLAKVLGTFPMSFDGPACKGLFKVKWHDLTVSALLFAFLLTLSFLKISLADSFIVESVVLQEAWGLSLIAGLYITLAQLAFQIYKRNEIKQFLRHLDDFDLEVSCEEFKLAVTL